MSPKEDVRENHDEFQGSKNCVHPAHTVPVMNDVRNETPYKCENVYQWEVKCLFVDHPRASDSVPHETGNCEYVDGGAEEE